MRFAFAWLTSRMDFWTNSMGINVKHFAGGFLVGCLITATIEVLFPNSSCYKYKRSDTIEVVEQKQILGCPCTGLPNCECDFETGVFKYGDDCNKFSCNKYGACVRTDVSCGRDWRDYARHGKQDKTK